MTGYFLLPASQPRGAKKGRGRGDFGSRSCSPYRSHPHLVWSCQCPGISERGFHPHEEENNHVSCSGCPKHPLPSSRQGCQPHAHRHMPVAPRKDAKAKHSLPEKHLGGGALQLSDSSDGLSPRSPGVPARDRPTPQHPGDPTRPKKEPGVPTPRRGAPGALPFR